ncbi:hypothetical protein NDU88_000600 [Pleurodeles waltl]|uniref:Uncharacterized protein n=1 Tax=Pleurodeles waltl TaxID=8319 RepID=A0AAV7N8E3_PLEWA|nr:hypothetical protein NDU88_000600 [Pleurodeles waltl]
MCRCRDGAGLVAPPAEWAPPSPVRAWPSLRHRAVRGSGTRGTTTPLSLPKDRTTLGDVLLSSVHGHPALRAPGPRSALAVPAPARLQTAAVSRGTPRGRYLPPRPPQELRSSPERRAAHFRGVIRRPGPPLLRRCYGPPPESRSRTHGSREAPRRPPHHGQGLAG